MGWRRETWIVLAWVALVLGALLFIPDRLAEGLVGCDPPPESGTFANPFGECGLVNALVTLGLMLGILVVGAIGLLVTGSWWASSRPPRARCPNCRRPIRRTDAVCPGCGHDVRFAYGPPPGWGRRDGP